MAKFTFSTSRRVEFPILIDDSQLIALDEIIDRYMGPLREFKEQQIESEVNAELQSDLARGWLDEKNIEARKAMMRDLKIHHSSLGEDRRTTTVYLSGGKEIRAERFSEAISQPVGEAEEALGFATYVTVARIEARVRVTPNRQGLDLDVEPDSAEVAQEFFGALSNWASSIEAPRWQQRWVRAQGFLGFLFIAWIIAGGLLIPFYKWGNAGRNATSAEARRLLVQGINRGNELQAISLLLAIESDYSPVSQSSAVGPRYWSYYVLGALILLSSSISPFVSIGLWSGRQRLRRWRAWITALTYTIPVLLLGSVAIPWLLHWMRLTPPN